MFQQTEEPSNRLPGCRAGECGCVWVPLPWQPVPLLDPCCGGGARRRLQGATRPARGRGGVRRGAGLPSSPSSSSSSAPPSLPVPASRGANLFPPHRAAAGAAATAELPAAFRSPAATLKKFQPVNRTAAEPACVPVILTPFFLPSTPLGAVFI